MRDLPAKLASHGIIVVNNLSYSAKLSAVGKDCILDLILHRSSKVKIPVEALTKFTTRHKRIVDSKYYDFVSEEQFDLLEKSGQIIFPYYKRGARYGFDRGYRQCS